MLMIKDLYNSYKVMILRILLVNLFEAELLVSSLPQAASASRPYLGLRMSEPLRGCYVGSYNLQGDCVSLQLAEGHKGSHPAMDMR